VITLIFAHPTPVTAISEHTDRLASSLVGYSSPITIEGNWPEPKPAPSTGRGCVRYLRQKGIPVPPNPLIASKYLPVDSTELPPEGVPVIIVSYISPLGHVSWGQNIGGRLVNIYDSAGMTEVPLSVYKGYVKV